MSRAHDLPGDDAPFREKLKVAFENSRYKSARALGLALGMKDGSLVRKWFNGTYPELRYRQALEEELPVPPGYFQMPRVDPLEGLAEKVAALLAWQVTVIADLDDFRTRLSRLETARTKPRAAPKRQGRKA